MQIAPPPTAKAPPRAAGLEAVLALEPLGLGLGIDVHSQQPDWRELLATGREHFDYFEVYTRGEPAAAREVVAAVARATELGAAPLPLLYHHENLDPAYPGACGSESLAAAAANVRELGALWCVEELAYRQVDGRYLDFFAPALLTDASIAEIIANVRRLQAELPCPLVPENPPYQLPMGRRHVLELLGELARGAGCAVVLDIGHLYSYQLCAGLAPLARLEALALDRVIEVHLAGARIDDAGGVPLFQDLHGAAPIPSVCLEMAEEILPRLPHVKAVTIEVEDASAAYALEQARQVGALPSVRALRARAHAARGRA